MKKIAVIVVTISLFIILLTNQVFGASLEELEEAAKEEYESDWEGLAHDSWGEHKINLLGMTVDAFKGHDAETIKSKRDEIMGGYNWDDLPNQKAYWEKFFEVVLEGKEENKKENTGKSDIELYRELKKEAERLINEEKLGIDSEEIQNIISQMNEIYNKASLDKTTPKEELEEMHSGILELQNVLDINNKMYLPVGRIDKDNAETLDDVINDAETILTNSSQIERESIVKFSQSIYNIFLTMGTVVAVIVGAILGLKFMMSSVEGKADVKKMLIVYAVGCIVVFASFGIWKIVITVLQYI